MEDPRRIRGKDRQQSHGGEEETTMRLRRSLAEIALGDKVDRGDALNLLFAVCSPYVLKRSLTALEDPCAG